MREQETRCCRGRHCVCHHLTVADTAFFWSRFGVAHCPFCRRLLLIAEHQAAASLLDGWLHYDFRLAPRPGWHV